MEKNDSSKKKAMFFLSDHYSKLVTQDSELNNLSFV